MKHVNTSVSNVNNPVTLGFFYVTKKFTFRSGYVTGDL